VDIWALGCALYFIVYKKDPFEGRDPVEIKKKILNFKMTQVQPLQPTNGSQQD
jgi:hypothetical protein